MREASNAQQPMECETRNEKIKDGEERKSIVTIIVRYRSCAGNLQRVSPAPRSGEKVYLDNCELVWQNAVTSGEVFDFFLVASINELEFPISMQAYDEIEINKRRVYCLEEGVPGNVIRWKNALRSVYRTHAAPSMQVQRKQTYGYIVPAFARPELS